MKSKTYLSINEKKIEVDTEKSILENALLHKIKINHSCGQMGTCGTCRVEVLNFDEQIIQNLLAPRNEIENEMANDRGFNDNERLSCQTYPVADLKIKTSDHS